MLQVGVVGELEPIWSFHSLAGGPTKERALSSLLPWRTRRAVIIAAVNSGSKEALQRVDSHDAMLMFLSAGIPPCWGQLRHYLMRIVAGLSPSLTG